jgi:adenylate cyclase
MAKEIEMKFLVDANWQQLALSEGCIFHSTTLIRQGYISTGNNTVRVRTSICNGRYTAHLTVKGMSNGISRDEYEYEIPVVDANEMLATLCGNKIEKIRQVLIDKSKQHWEVDTFQGDLAGLVLAEIELNDADQAVALQSWTVKDVSKDVKYTNAYLSTNKHE